MELKDFISKTLQEITLAIKEAQDNIVDGGVINPKNIRVCGDGRKYADASVGKGEKPVQDIEFDVAVTATEGKETKGGIGVFVGAVGAGSQGQSEKSNTSYSRIKFSVPVLFPQQDEQRNK